MSILNHLAQAAAILLLTELLVIVIIFAAISGGMAFGLHWIRGKAGGWFQIGSDYASKGAGYVHTGTDYAAKPIIMAAGIAERIKGTAESIRRRVRQAQHVDEPPIAATAVQPPEHVM